MLDKKIKKDKAEKVFWDEKTQDAYIRAWKALRDSVWMK